MAYTDNNKAHSAAKPVVAKAKSEAGATLDDSIVDGAAELLLEAAEARALAALLGDKADAADLLSYAAALEESAGKWEQRLAWWKRLRRRQTA